MNPLLPACMVCGLDAELDSSLCAGCNDEKHEAAENHERHVRGALDAWQAGNPDRMFRRWSDDRGWTVALYDMATDVEVRSTKPTAIDALANALQAMQGAEVAA